MNQLTAYGNLTADPVIKTVSGDKSVSNVSLAISAGKDKPAKYFDFDVWSGNTKALAFLKKGNCVGFTSRMEVTKFQYNGVKRTKLKNTVISVDLLPKGSRVTGYHEAKISGNLTREVEVKKGGVVTFSIAVNESYKGVKSTKYFDVATFEKNAEVAKNNLKKGMMVQLTGRIDIRQFQREDGTKGESVTFIPNDKGGMRIVWPSKEANATANTTSPINDDSGFDEIPF